MKKTIFVFGGLSVLILLLFQLEKWSLFTLGGSENLYVIITGILFLILGMLTSRYFFIKQTRRKRELAKSSLSDQELRVLNLIAEGFSNKEIAEQLFIAETTVKTHVSKIFTKLNAKGRTEAVKIGKGSEFCQDHIQYKIIPSAILKDSIQSYEIPCFFLVGNYDMTTPQCKPGNKTPFQN